MDSSSGTYMELHFRLKLSENLGEICHMVSRNELFCQNFCIKVASTVVWTELLWRSWIHGRFMRIILETYIIWMKVPKIPNHKLSHFFKSQKRFLCLSNLHRFRLRFSSCHQAAPGCRGQFSPRWKTGRRALVLERRCSGSTKQCEGFWEF